MLNFRFTSEFQTIHRRPFPLAYPAILDPTNIRPLVDGEWLQLNDLYQMDRGSGAAACPSFVCVSEQGRYETQAIGKTAFAFMGPFEAETKIMDAATVGTNDPLMVNDVTIGVVRRALVLKTSTNYIVGYCTRLPTNNGGWLRFVHLS